MPDLRTWAMVFAGPEPSPSQVGETGWLRVMLTFSALRGAADGPFVAENWALLGTAYQNAATGAVRAGEITALDAVIRQSNFWASLVGDLTSDEEIAQLGEPVVAGILQELPKSLAWARAESVDWPTRPIETMRQLRNIKNLLGPVEALVRSGVRLEAGSDIARWLELRPSLP